jgi:hypothetical protein
MALFDTHSQSHLVELGLVVVVVKKLFNKPEKCFVLCKYILDIHPGTSNLFGNE